MLASWFLFLAMPAQGAENAPLNAAAEDYYFQDMPVVLTASRLSQPLSEAPSAMTVIDREMIKASGFRTVPELMQLVPGMYVGYVDGNTPVLSLHNSTDQYSRQMQVLIDGRSVYMPPLGGVNWADLPLLIDDIERIEVVRGPSSASHGTNSFYGVINIITRDVSSETGSGRLSLTGGYASDASAKFNRIGEQFDYRIFQWQLSSQWHRQY
jgi:iron complex outermembrane receptor protein